MQAVVLAGGLGTRLRPITQRIPKPMVPIRGIPYLEYQLRALGQQSITDVVLLVGYLGDQIVEYFGDGARLGLSIRYSRERAPMGTGGALRLGLPLLEEVFLVVYGDSYLPMQYGNALQVLENSSAEGLLVVYDNRFGETSVPNNVDIAPNGLVTRYEKNGIGLSYVEAGVLAFRRSAIERIPVGRVFSLEMDLYPQLIAEGGLFALPTCKRFYDIGTHERLAAIEELLAP